MTGQTLSLGVIGSPVTFAGMAASVMQELHPNLAELKFYRSGEAMIEALLGGEVDAAVGAHASSGGGYTSFGDRLIKPDSTLYLIYEKAMPFHCCLLAKNGARLNDIKVIHGGPASLPLAKDFVAQNMPQARCETYTSSSGTVDRILAGDGQEAMLGTRGLAEQAGLAILAENIDGETVSGNFWVISTKALFSPKPTTLIVTVRAADGGELGQLVERLATVGYRLSTVAVRPTGAGLLEFDYLMRLHGKGLLAEVRAAVDANANARLAGAIT